MNPLADDLKKHIKGCVRADLATLYAYSVDASIYEVMPTCVVQPSSKADLLAAVEIAREHRVPIIPRGAGTGLTGGAVGHGLVIDCSRFLHRVLEVNEEKEYVVCEPGVVQDDLNALLAPKGYRLGPNTSTSGRATIGGMIANNSAGSNSIRFGAMIDHTLEVELLLSSGQFLRFGELSEEEFHKRSLQGNFEGRVLREIVRILERYEGAIRQNFPPLKRRVSGYCLDALIEHYPPNLAKLIASSEGSLGLISEATLKIVKTPQHTALLVVHCKTLYESLCHVDLFLSFSPLALETIDAHIIELGRVLPSLTNHLDWLEGRPQGILAIEMDADDEATLKAKVDAVATAIAENKIGYHTSILFGKEEIKKVWALRKAAVGILMSKRSYSRAIAFIEDLAVAPTKLADFVEELRAYLQSLGKDAGIYGHAGAGCIHIRPFIDLRQAQERTLVLEILHNVCDIVKRYGGAMSGEHGDGFVRSFLNKKIFGEDVYQAFKQIKAVFDRDNLMNPGTIVDGPDPTANLRAQDPKQSRKIETFFSFDGGIELAADMCNGNAACRNKSSLMCPSFQASGDENDTTRARAQNLRAIINGKSPDKDLSSEHLHNVLDLCLECKGCKRDCPSQVDMAKMKAEALYQYQLKNGVSIWTELMCSLVSWAPLASAFAPLSNIGLKLARFVLPLIGFAKKRHLPSFAWRRLSTLLKRREAAKDGKPIAIFCDTYSEFYEPKVFTSALTLLERMGFKPHIIPWTCCGRPLISKGLLPSARKHAHALLTALEPCRAMDIIILEPSCLSALKDDYKDLVDREKFGTLADEIAQRVLSFEEFLAKTPCEGLFQKPAHEFLVHLHCHQKALIGRSETMKAFSSAGLLAKEIPTSCCGMAGSFGYEEAHYALSRTLAFQKLIPAIDASEKDQNVIASGFSCRCQVAHFSRKRARHICEVLVELL